MNIETFRAYCLAKKGVTEELPFGPTTLVFKTMGKMFALTSLDAENFSINLKCDPENAEELREHHTCVVPGYHMNKKHWNTILVDGSVPDQKLCEWIDHSYGLIISALPRKVKQQLDDL